MTWHQKWGGERLRLAAYYLGNNISGGRIFMFKLLRYKKIN